MLGTVPGWKWNKGMVAQFGVSLPSLCCPFRCDNTQEFTIAIPCTIQTGEKSRKTSLTMEN